MNLTDIAEIIKENGVALILTFILVVLSVRILKKPIKLILKFLLNVFCGFIALIIIDYIGAYIGVNIELNGVNAAVVGVLGVPGVAILLIIQLIV